MNRFALAALVALTACTPGEVYPPRPPPVPIVGDACEAAQVRLEQLGCREAKSPKGTPFGRVCRDVAAMGVDLKPECIAHVIDCKEVASCR